METLEQGGWILGAILLLSTLVWGVIIYRWLVLRHEIAKNTTQANLLLNNIRKNKIQRHTLNTKAPRIVDQLILLSLTHKGQISALQKRQELLFKNEFIRLQTPLKLLSACVAVMPLLGLLGTILGILKTFHTLALPGQENTNDFISIGISQALITTQAGLLAALPVLIAIGILRLHIRKYKARIHVFIKNINIVVSERQKHV